MWLKKSCAALLKCRRFCTHGLISEINACNDSTAKYDLPEPEYDLDYICNPCNRDVIYDNIRKRKSCANIDKILELSKHSSLSGQNLVTFLQELSKVPNRTDPSVQSDTENILRECGEKLQYEFTPKEFSDLAGALRLIRMESLGRVAGQRAYTLFGDLAELEEALIQFTTERLLQCGFKLISVPDILPTKVIERCGLLSDHGHTLVYNLHDSYGEYSLSGTAEMALAYRLMNQTFSSKDLPLRLAAVSRCYRAETSNVPTERGIYRVHQFTKVEMFVCATHEQSAQVFDELLRIQEDLFSSLGLYYRVVDMPQSDLGPAAYRKVDIEGWMPGRCLYGELSSCSNCTDYQSRRLNIKYRTDNGEILHAHTLNGTGCALPRMLIALCETYQTSHSRIRLPDTLLPYMSGLSLIKKQPVAEMREFKYKPPIC